MQDQNEDTEWNDTLRKFKIIPEKEKEITEEDMVKLVEETIKEKTSDGKKNIEDLNLDELDLLEDEEDDRVLLAYRNKRIAEMKAQASLAKFGEVIEITAVDYVQQVNEAGEGIYVILHLYKPGIPLSALVNMFLAQLAAKFPQTKFIKSYSTTCIPNYPDKNLPTIFIYKDGEMIKNMMGPAYFSENLKIETLEWMLSTTGAIKSDIKKDPRPKIRDSLFSSLRANNGGAGDSDDDNDW